MISTSKNTWTVIIFRLIIFVSLISPIAIMFIVNYNKHNAEIIEDINIEVVEEVVEKVEEIDPQIIIRQKNIKIITEYIIELQPKLDDQVAEIIATSIVKHARKYKFPPELIAVLIYRESSFNLISVSSANCVGLMQINPKAHDDKIKKFELNYNDLFKIDNNINLGCIILNEYYRRDKNIISALTRYVGSDHQKYIIDILSEFTDLQIRKIKDPNLFQEMEIETSLEEISTEVIIDETVTPTVEITETKS